jgi:hypothetical protein
MTSRHNFLYLISLSRLDYGVLRIEYSMTDDAVTNFIVYSQCTHLFIIFLINLTYSP